MRRCTVRRCSQMERIASAQTLLGRRDWAGAMRELNDAKRVAGTSQLHRDVDYLRAVVFIQQQDVLHARQCLLEGLRHFPDHGEARDLLAVINKKTKAIFDLPPEVARDEPLFAMVYDGIRDDTMLNWQRLFNLFRMTKDACTDSNDHGTELAVVECGVAGGGSSIVMAVAAQHYCSRPVRVYSCDTFRGMPPPTNEDVRQEGTYAAETGWGEGTCSAPPLNVTRLANAYGVNVQVVEGLFEDTLPSLVSGTGSNALGGRTVGVLHIDADWYSSTLTALRCLYPVLATNGYVQIDDYHYWDGCGKAVKQYFDAEAGEGRAFREPTWQSIDGNAVWGTKVDSPK